MHPLPPDDCRLIAGPYRAPAIPSDGVLYCHVRGRVRVGGLTDAPIPWPFEATVSRHKPLVVCGDLLRALGVESATAVAWHWGVNVSWVARKRTALGIGPETPGTTRLRKSRQRQAAAGRVRTPD